VGGRGRLKGEIEAKMRSKTARRPRARTVTAIRATQTSLWRSMCVRASGGCNMQREPRGRAHTPLLGWSFPWAPLVNMQEGTFCTAPLALHCRQQGLAQKRTDRARCLPLHCHSPSLPPLSLVAHLCVPGFTLFDEVACALPCLGVSSALFGWHFRRVRTPTCVRSVSRPLLLGPRSFTWRTHRPSASAPSTWPRATSAPSAASTRYGRCGARSPPLLSPAPASQGSSACVRVESPHLQRPQHDLLGGAGPY